MNEINEEAVNRIETSNINGISLLEMFKSLQYQMQVINAEGNFIQFEFIEPGELKEGDLIPELHLSLRTYHEPRLEK